MKLTFVACSCCNESMAVPGNVAVRVMNGESHVVCELCLEGAIEHYDAESDGLDSTEYSD